MLEYALVNFSGWLIEFMAVLLLLALIFRSLAFRSSRQDDIYFSTFTKEVEKILDEEKSSDQKIQDVDRYLADLLGRVMDKLPKRALRLGSTPKQASSKVNAKKVVAIRDYVGGQKSLINSINSESGVFKSPHPPNYTDLTSRILNQDPNWVKLFGVIPIDGISRMIDILPGLFIVFGVFGTFIGINQALPEIAKIDFNNLEASGEILTRFVTSVTFSMKTSIAGILFSLILTFLNTWVPIKGLRNRTFKKVANCFESVWYAIHGGGQVDKKISEALPVLIDYVEKIEQHLANKDKKAA